MKRSGGTPHGRVARSWCSAAAARWAAVLLVVAAAGCSSSSSSEPTTTPEPATVESAAPPTSDSAIDTAAETSAPTVSSATTSTTPATSTTELVTTTTAPPIPQVPAGVNWVAAASPPAAAALPTFEEIVATAGMPAAPAERPHAIRTRVHPPLTLAGARYVAADIYWSPSPERVIGHGRNVPYLFRSADGATWGNVDITATLGDVNGFVDSVAEFNGTLIGVVTVTDSGHNAATKIEVLTSVDGLGWQKISELAGAGSILGDRLYVFGGSIVLLGFDDACSFDGTNANAGVAPAHQSRAWSSQDGGVTWVEVPAASAGLDVKPPVPTDPSGCAELAGSFAHNALFDSHPRAVEVLGDRLFVWSADGVRVAGTADGVTWATSTLTVALPTPSATAPDVSAQSMAAALFTTDDGLVALNLEQHRHGDGSRSTTDGVHVLSWRSTDGTTWMAQPPGRPFDVDDQFSDEYAFTMADGHLSLQKFVDSMPSDFYYTSVAGPQQDWLTCTPAPAADCPYAESFGAVTPNADLSEINLANAIVGPLDWRGVNMTGANLAGATFNETTLTGADLTLAEMRGTHIFADLTGVTLKFASFYDVFTDGRAFAAGLEGLALIGVHFQIDTHPIPAGTSFAVANVDGGSLTGVTFEGTQAVLGDLRGFDFSGTGLSGASFIAVDLTGADFAGADVSRIDFDASTICPDGAPADPAAEHGAACRL